MGTLRRVTTRGSITMRVSAVAMAIALLPDCGGGDGGGTNSAQTLAITAGSPPAGTTGTAYAGYAFTAAGGTAPLNWSETGSMPPGLQLSASGQLSGNPSTAGTYPISVMVSDSSMPPVTASAAVSLKINDSTIVIAPAAPPNGYASYPYSGVAFTASGGSPPYSWTSDGTLPPGLVLASNGKLSGTPTQAGSFSFSVTATDSAKPALSASPLKSQILITTPPLPPTIDNQEPLTGTVGSEYGYQFTASNGAAPLAWSDTPSLTMGLSLSPQGRLSGTPTSPGQFLITLTVTDALNRAASAPMTVRVSPTHLPGGFAPTGHLSIPRAGHSATLLLTGKVLVAGGGNGAADATAELYDPAAGTFSPTVGNMTDARSGHTATLLKLSSSNARNYGKVLIAGSGDKTAELYDPVASANPFAATGSMNHARTSPTATLLNTGEVLIVGGSTTANDPTAELYDPATGIFSFTGSTAIARNGHTATLLSDGRVLIAGGGTDTAELYDPGTGKFSLTAGTMSEPRSGHTATLLGSADNAQSGFVLIIGGDGTAELYDPGKGTFAAIGSLVPSMRPSYLHTASLLSDGTVLAAGGYDFVGGCGQAPSAENAAAVFDPVSDGFTATVGTLFTARDSHTATVLQDGTVLIVGGMQHILNSSGPPPECVTNLILSSAELYRIAQKTNPPLTGSCWGSANSQQCETIRDLIDCPVGVPSIRPGAVSGGCWPPSGAEVDLSRLCTLGSHLGRRIYGYCVIQ